MTSTSRLSMPILARQLRASWRGQLGWSLGLAAVIGLYLPLFPTLQSPQLVELIETLPPELVSTLGYDDISSGAGYTQASFFGLLGFLLGTIACISWGTAAIAGAEERGELELTLAHAIGRRQYAAESVATLVVRIVTLGAVVAALILACNVPFELDLSFANVLAVTLAWASLCLLSGLAALTVGALTGRRAWSLGAGTAVAVIGYGLDAVGRQSDNLAWLSKLSPFAWAYGNTPLENGFDWGGLGLLWAAGALCAVITITALAHRDILG